MPIPRLSKRILGRVALGVFAVFVMAALAIQASLIQNLYMRSELEAADSTKDMLIDTVKALNLEPAVEPTTGRLFIPASRLVLPPSSSLHQYYRRGSDEFMLLFIDTANQAQAISKMRTALSVADVFKEVATLHICNRQVAVSLIQAHPDLTVNTDKLRLDATKKLKDGRTAYIYQNESCPYGAEALLEQVGQIDSF